MNKFRAVKTTVDGITFDSKREAKRYCELKLLQMAGEISELNTQPVFRLSVPDATSDGVSEVCKYVGDFRYVKNGQVVVEDVKSKPTMTPLYRLKKKLMRALHGIEIVEV